MHIKIIYLGYFICGIFLFIYNVFIYYLYIYIYIERERERERERGERYAKTKHEFAAKIFEKI